MNNDLLKKLVDLRMIIAMEEENYKSAIQQHANFNSLKEIRANIKKLKGDISILVDDLSHKN